MKSGIRGRRLQQLDDDDDLADDEQQEPRRCVLPASDAFFCCRRRLANRCVCVCWNCSCDRWKRSCCCWIAATSSVSDLLPRGSLVSEIEQNVALVVDRCKQPATSQYNRYTHTCIEAKSSRLRRTIPCRAGRRRCLAGAGSWTTVRAACAPFQVACVRQPMPSLVSQAPKTTNFTRDLVSLWECSQTLKPTFGEYSYSETKSSANAG